MSKARFSYGDTLLPNGKVLISGGFNNNPKGYFSDADLYDPASGTWTPTGHMSTPRHVYMAALLPNGNVLVAGGRSGIGQDFLVSAELYNPATETWTVTAPLSTPRNTPTLNLLPNGKVLVAGSWGGSGYLSTAAGAELYDPATATWTPTSAMVVPRNEASATLLPNGKVLILGGGGTNGLPLSSAELYGEPPLALQITAQPQSQTGYWGKSISLSVGISGGALPLSYQWLKDDVLIPGATDSLLVLANLQTTNAGVYRVVVTDAASNTTNSQPATLVVKSPGVSIALYSGVTIDGVTGQTYGIQMTTSQANTNSWAGVTNVTLAVPTQIWYDSQPASQPQRYYRVVPGPISIP